MKKFKAPAPIDGERVSNYIRRLSEAFEKWANEVAAERVAQAAEATADEITEWARSRKNKGPFADEAYRINIHLSAMLSKFITRLRTP